MYNNLVKNDRPLKLVQSLLFMLLIFFSGKQGFAQFLGKSGVYFLGSADVTIPASKYSNLDISGAVCRFRWGSVETAPGHFNWDFIDGEILKAKNANKKISLQPLGYPEWIIDSLNAQVYYYIDKNPNHPTYGEIVSNVLPWDPTYIQELKNFIQHLSVKYANDTSVAYLNLIGGQISRGLPDTVITDTVLLIKQPFWTSFNYNADTLAVLMDSMIVYYMELFPVTPLWCSVDYVKFEYNASGRLPNYLASLYTDFGISNYPQRFGLFREDISGCTAYNNVNPGSQWNIMKNNPCRTGAQMLWSVQDGPARMNQCGMLPNTKQFVLDSAVNKGIAFGMRYIEIYGADIDDPALATNIANANKKLINKGNQCNEITGLPSLIPDEWADVKYYPNPVESILTITLPQKSSVEIYDLTGRKFFSRHKTNVTIEIDCANFPVGVYLVLIKDEKNHAVTRKIIKF